MCQLALNTLDVRGRSCPEPVLLTRRALEQAPNGVQVLVGNSTARDNVRRFAESKGYKVQIQDQGEDFLLSITR
ncbi:MAG: sulfurtransferase TusA family protein [Bacillota bacterium]|jgi:TusA-related sulfurtransferase|nr:sulfurtransferase TusA family protein [Bacillota bacterium]